MPQQMLNGMFRITIHEAKHLPKTDNMGFTEGDPLCVLKDGHGTVLMRTPHVDKTRNPKWEIQGDVSLVDCSCLHFEILDKDVSMDELMTETKLYVDKKTLAPVLQGSPISGWIPLEKRKSEIKITVQPLFHKVAGVLGVRNTRFPANRGCRVTLFQSAHIGSERDYLPRLQLYNGYDRGFGSKKNHPNPQHGFEIDDDLSGTREFTPRNAWEELYVAILEARYFIYVVGWSVNVDIPLLRERNVVVKGYEHIDGTKIPLGELLNMKAGPQEGVRVMILTWREATSIAGAHDGVAGTYSEQTKDFFRKKGGNVHIKTVMRASQDAVSLNMFCYTHHQKYIVMDSPSLSGSSKPRRVIGFLGGLDVTKGRYDTPKKHLWGTNGTWHNDDFYQNCVPGADKTCCRQPWQDIHSKLEGAVTRDLVINFEERWQKQTSDKNHDALFRVDLCGDILSRDQDYVCDPDHHEAWNVQLFRSIDHTSSTTVLGVEGGIHNAYEHAINRAERFLYIENQYFMGGSKEWDAKATKSKKEGLINMLSNFIRGDEVQAVNRIPILVMERITRAIQENKRFTAYICIPMFPEGLPESAPMQEILYWQFHTMEMMYKHITEIIQRCGVNAVATDYLNFFCLGNREPGASSGGSAGTRPDLVKRSRRHMIYVHSKLLIVDDDYVILGSANINDRSMAGNRDTEICIGAYQPQQSRDAGVKYPNGHVQAFRLSLWGEHLNMQTVDPSLYYPESKECVDFINNRTGTAWMEHASETVMEQTCHMMKYPIVLNPDGTISPIQETFPDAPGAYIKGKDSSSIPDFMTS
eukprot:TRINITY_DN1005_c1_g1_i2.p1 TRINITY_DN1005_c1_g1~~TRINITY_DN1005_c1_g1_i2.p1  ORF type:complete len:809 (+),score=221.99 TRINITY_DN1005_c1_g1_i2:87-2513(+)